MEVRKNTRRMFTGRVTSDKMNKTRVVQIQRVTKHPKYHKTVKTAAAFKAHDEKNVSKTGDWVRIMETRRLSKDKRWVITEVLKSQKEIEVEA